MSALALLLAGCGSRTGLEEPTLADDGSDAGPPQGDAAPSEPQSILLFGGLGETPDGGYADQDDTWIWTATNGWNEAHPPQSPSGRFGAMAASLHGDVVLFGGDGSVAETWAWNGTTWAQQQPSWSPPPLVSSVFGVLGESLVLFGGYDEGTIYDDVWQWNGTSWTHENPSVTPSARQAPAGAILDGSLVIFGGEDDDFLPLGDTWVFDGTSWTQMQPAHSPSPRSCRGHLRRQDRPLWRGHDPPIVRGLAQRRRDVGLGRHRLDPGATGAVARRSQLRRDGGRGRAGRPLRRRHLRGKRRESGRHVDMGRDDVDRAHRAWAWSAKLPDDGREVAAQVHARMMNECSQRCAFASGGEASWLVPPARAATRRLGDAACVTSNREVRWQRRRPRKSVLPLALWRGAC